MAGFRQRVQCIADKMTRRIEILREGGDETAIARAHLSKAVVELREVVEALYDGR